jgi:hypothetical protein
LPATAREPQIEPGDAGRRQREPNSGCSSDVHGIPARILIRLTAMPLELTMRMGGLPAFDADQKCLASSGVNDQIVQSCESATEESAMETD